MNGPPPARMAFSSRARVTFFPRAGQTFSREMEDLLTEVVDKFDMTGMVNCYFNNYDGCLS
jgi:hypothetical protein